MKPLPWRDIFVGIAIVAGTTAVGAAVETRDRVAACEAEDRRQADVNAERFSAIKEAIDGLRQDLKERRP